MLEYIQCVIISAVTPRVECWCQKFKESLVFSVTPFKIDQNKNQDLLIGKTRNLTNENCKHAKILAKISGHSNVSYARYAERPFTQVYSDLYGNAILMPIQMGTNVAVLNQQKHLSLSFATKGGEFISRGTQKH